MIQTKRMNSSPSQLLILTNRLRWAVPLALASIGAAYILIKETAFEGQILLTPDIFFAFIVLCVGGPLLAWFSLTWTAQVARSEAAAQRELDLRNQELAALNAIGDVLSQSTTSDASLDTALRQVLEIVGVPAGEIRLLVHDRLVLKSACGMTFADAEVNLGMTDCLCGTCAHARQPVAAGDGAPSSIPLDSPCGRQGFRSVLVSPMISDGRVVGTITFASQPPGALGAREQRILAGMRQRLTMAVENASLYEETYRRATHLETASLVSQRVTALLDPDNLLCEVARLIREKFGYYHVHIFMVDDQAREIVLRAADGVSAKLMQARGVHLTLGKQGITAWVAKTGQALLCNDVSREPRYLPIELLPETKSEMAVPLRVGTRVVGVLDVQETQVNRFNKDDITVLQLLGNQLGIAIENARLFAETRRRYEAMVALHETSLDVISQLDRQELLNALLRRGVQLWGAVAGALWLYDPQRKTLTIVASHNYPKTFNFDLAIRPGEGFVGRVYETGEPLSIEDYTTWSGRIPGLQSVEYPSGMAAPLKWANRVFGVISFSNYRKMKFDENQVWLLTLFADLISIALRNAELHTQVREFSEDLERKVAERTQQLTLAKEELATKAEQLQTLLAKTIHIQEEERARIAREMHDGVIQLITAARYELKALQVNPKNQALGTDSPDLERTRQILDEMEQEIRRAIYDLHPPALDAIDLLPALRKYTKNFQALAGVQCDLRITGTPLHLPTPLEVAIFRIVEQGLQNIATHAGATSALVSLSFGAELLCLEVQDNGRGFAYDQELFNRTNTHLGLVSMQERVRNLDGTMQVITQPGQGTCLRFYFPLYQNQD